MKLKVVSPEPQTINEIEVENHGVFAVVRYPDESMQKWATAGVLKDVITNAQKTIQEATGIKEIVFLAESVRLEVVAKPHTDSMEVWEECRQVWEYVIKKAEEHGCSVLVEQLIEEAEEAGYEKLDVRPV